MDAALYVLSSVTQYTDLHVYIGRLMCEAVFQLILHFYLNIIKLKYTCHRCFHGDLEMPQYVRNSNFLIFKSALLEVKLLTNCGGKFDKFN